MRISSIHTRADIFTQVLVELASKHNISKQVAKVLAEEAINACAAFPVTHRSIKVSNEKLLKKTNRVSMGRLSGALLFAKILTLCRQKAKHRGVITLTPDSPEWPQLKATSELADQFCAEFQLSPKEGYYKYLELGIAKMKKFHFNKLYNMHSGICTEYEARLKLTLDETPEATREACSTYQNIIYERTGLPPLTLSQLTPEKQAVFISVKETAQRIGVGVKLYITAQFEAFAFKDGVPDPLQMVGPQAEARVAKYCYENNINIRNLKKDINFKALKDARDNS